MIFVTFTSTIIGMYGKKFNLICGGKTMSNAKRLSREFLQRELSPYEIAERESRGYNREFRNTRKEKLARSEGCYKYAKEEHFAW